MFQDSEYIRRLLSYLRGEIFSHVPHQADYESGQSQIQLCSRSRGKVLERFPGSIYGPRRYIRLYTSKTSQPIKKMIINIYQVVWSIVYLNPPTTFFFIIVWHTSSRKWGTRGNHSVYVQVMLSSSRREPLESWIDIMHLHGRNSKRLEKIRGHRKMTNILYRSQSFPWTLWSHHKAYVHHFCFLGHQTTRKKNAISNDKDTIETKKNGMPWNRDWAARHERSKRLKFVCSAQKLPAGSYLLLYHLSCKNRKWPLKFMHNENEIVLVQLKSRQKMFRTFCVTTVTEPPNSMNKMKRN